MDDFIIIWSYLGIIALAIKIYLHIKIKYPKKKGLATVLKYSGQYFSLNYLFPIAINRTDSTLTKKAKIANILIFFFYFNMIVLFCLIKINFSNP